MFRLCFLLTTITVSLLFSDFFFYYDMRIKGIYWPDRPLDIIKNVLLPKEEYVKQMDDKKTAMTKAVTSLFYRGLTVAQIAEELHISKRTVISRKNDAKKLGWIPFRGKFFEKSLCWTV